MKTNVVVNVKVIVPITHLDSAVESFVEKLARDEVVDILNCAENKINIKEINAIAKIDDDNIKCEGHKRW